MSEIKVAEVTVTVRVPYAEHDDDIQYAIRSRARDIGEDRAFLASWLGVEADQPRDDVDDFYAPASVSF